MVLSSTFITNNIIGQSNGRKYNLITLRSSIDLKRALDAQAKFSSLRQNIKPFEDIVSVKDCGDIDNIVVIIGESASRSHYSLYDYYLKTSPNLDTLKNELYIFDDIISPYSGTSAVMEVLLTFKSADMNGEWYEYPNIVD